MEKLANHRPRRSLRMNGEQQEPRRLIINFEPRNKALSFDFRAGVPVKTERVSPGVLLERDGQGAILRLLITEMGEQWLTNAFLGPSIACTLNGCEQMRGPFETKLYEIGLGGSERTGSLYFDPMGDPTIASDKERVAKQRLEEGEELAKEFRGFIAESFEINPDFKRKYLRLYERFRSEGVIGQ
jgi:hypothetical protein